MVRGIPLIPIINFLRGFIEEKKGDGHGKHVDFAEKLIATHPTYFYNKQCRLHFHASKPIFWRIGEKNG
jgi:hypothetical protein